MARMEILTKLRRYRSGTVRKDRCLWGKSKNVLDEIPCRPKRKWRGLEDRQIYSSCLRAILWIEKPERGITYILQKETALFLVLAKKISSFEDVPAVAKAKTGFVMRPTVTATSPEMQRFLYLRGERRVL